MVSISHRSFEFHRSIGTDGLTEMIAVAKKNKGPAKIYTINLKNRTASKHSKNYTSEIRVPTKMAAAMIHACIQFDLKNQHLRVPWRPRWQA